MLEVFVIRQGKNYGEQFDIRSSRAFSSKKKAIEFLEFNGYKKTKQPTGGPLWLHEEKNTWAEPIKLTLDKVEIYE